MLKSKRGQQFSWIFAVIVGAVILFLAFYFVGQKITTQKFQETTVLTQSLDTVMTPFSFLGSQGSASARVVELPQKAEIKFNCTLKPDPGSSSITMTMIETKNQTGISRVSYDKYLFAEKMQTKKFQLVSMPVEMPWRVADAIILFPMNTYCFIDAPDMFDTLKKLNISVNFTDRVSECPENSIRVCFGTSSCDINVHGDCGYGCYDYGYVSKQGASIYFIKGTLAAAIFSDKDLYECNIKRLANRLAMQCNIYKEKAASLSCQTIDSGLIDEMKTAALQTSRDISEANFMAITSKINDLNSANRNAACTLY